MRITITIEDVESAATAGGGDVGAPCAIELLPALDVWRGNTPAAAKARAMLAAIGIHGPGKQGTWDETHTATKTGAEVQGTAPSLKLVGDTNPCEEIPLNKPTPATRWPHPSCAEFHKQEPQDAKPE